MFRSVYKAALVASLSVSGMLALDVALDGGFLVPEVHAVIGRPITPMSYAGVARRTTRRAIYATSVYQATLPAGCRTVAIDGTTLHQCGATYYQPTGGRYVVVQVQ